MLGKEKKFRKTFLRLSVVHPKDPKKLKTLKESLKKNENEYFTCMS